MSLIFKVEKDQLVDFDQCASTMTTDIYVTVIVPNYPENALLEK